MDGAGVGTRVRRLLAGHGIGLAAVLLGTLLNAAVLTDGTTTLTVSPNRYAFYYDALGDSLLRGRFDVPFQAIQNEAFLIDGKVYGYFGPTPALLRIPLNAAFPRMRGRWTRSVMIAATFLALLATWLVRREARRAAGREPSRGAAWLDAAFVLCAAAGTTLLFISRRPILYHEAMAVGIALAAWAYVLLLRYLRAGRLGSALGATACAILAFQARGSAGLGALAAVFLLVAALVLRLRRAAPPDRPALRAHAAVLAAVVVLSTAAVAWKNQRVFGSLSGMPSLVHHVQIMQDPQRLARTGGDFFQPANLRTTLHAYLYPGRVWVLPQFPFVFAVPRWDVTVFEEARLDQVEEVASLPAVSPLWVLLAAVGVVVALAPGVAGAPALARFRIPIAGAAAGAAAIFFASTITHRFLHDAYPLLVLAGACGVEGAAALARRGRGWTVGIVSAGALLALYSCWASAAVTLTQPRW